MTDKTLAIARMAVKKYQSWPKRDRDWFLGMGYNVADIYFLLHLQIAEDIKDGKIKMEDQIEMDLGETPAPVQLPLPLPEPGE